MYSRTLIITGRKCHLLGNSQCASLFSQRLNHDFGPAATRKLSNKTVDVETVGKVRLIAINRPEKKNAVDTSTAHQLYQAFRDFENDDDINVAILYGKGGNFCSGFDLGELANCFRHTTDSLPDMPSRSERAPMGPTRMSFSKPVIAAITGYAVAGGLELALMCDMRVLDESAIMGVFCRRFGVPLIDGGTARLPQLIGLSRALDMILTGRPVDSKEALSFGLANRVVPTGTAVGQATQLALSISRFPQQCLRVDRSSAYYSAYNSASMQDALQNESFRAKDVIRNESLKGANSFMSGEGKHGSFDDFKEKT